MKWRKISLYAASILLLVMMLSCCYFLSYRKALNKFNESSMEHNYELMSYLKEITEYYGDSKVPNSTTVDTANEARVLPDTIYKLEVYDVNTNQTTVKIMQPPSKFIGLNREELMLLLSKEMLDLPLEEYQKGLLSYVLISFSEEQIVLRKSYNTDLIQYKYYIAIYDGKVVVYHCDKKTVFEYTGIDATLLSEKSQAELNQGIYVKDEAELYSLLESYSS